jgi:hypothetical protein
MIIDVANNSLCKMLNYKKDLLVGKRVTTIIPEGYR